MALSRGSIFGNGWNAIKYRPYPAASVSEGHVQRISVRWEIPSCVDFHGIIKDDRFRSRKPSTNFRVPKWKKRTQFAWTKPLFFVFSWKSTRHEISQRNRNPLYLDEPTLLSLSIEEQPEQCHVRCFFENTKVLICQTRFCTREPPLVSHTTAAFCSLSFPERQRKKNAQCVPAHTWKLSFGSYVIVYWLTYSTKTDAAIWKICLYL